MAADAIYRPAPSLHVTRPERETLRLKTENSLVELKGSSADLFESRILPMLDGVNSVKQICLRVGLKNVEDLGQLLHGLNDAGVLLRGRPEQDRDKSFLDYLELLGLDRLSIEQRLKDLKVAVVGDGVLGRAVYHELSALHVGQVQLLASGHSATPADDLSEAELIRVAERTDYLVSTLGEAFAAIDYRVNRAVHQTGTAALFCRVGLTESVVGPVVFPSETACFTCWRMRAAACADDYERFMELEENAAQRQSPTEHPASQIGYLAQIVAGTAVNELLKSALALGEVAATDHILKFEPFKGGWSRHDLLRRPDCPDCAKKNFSFQNSLVFPA